MEERDNNIYMTSMDSSLMKYSSISSERDLVSSEIVSSNTWAGFSILVTSLVKSSALLTRGGQTS